MSRPDVLLELVCGTYRVAIGYPFIVCPGSPGCSAVGGNDLGFSPEMLHKHGLNMQLNGRIIAVFMVHDWKETAREHSDKPFEWIQT